MLVHGTYLSEGNLKRIDFLNGAHPSLPLISCHARAKSLGDGTHEGHYQKGYARGIYVGIMNEKGELMTKTARYRISPVPELTRDLPYNSAFLQARYRLVRDG